MTLRELAALLDCALDGDGSLEIAGVSDLEHAGPRDLTFYANARFRPQLQRTRAAAIIVGENEPDVGRPMLRTPRPYLAFARALSIFHPPARPAPGISQLAAVAPDADIAPDVSIGPFVLVGARARIGARTVVASHASIGDDTTIGDDCLLRSHVTVRERVTIGSRVVLHDGAVIGSDGFGFTQDADGRHQKIPQVGVVIIEDDVEIGANTTVDRPAAGETRIGAGTKIDNLVQLGHSVRVGRDVLMAAQVGVAGSAILEDRVTLGGQVGVADHIVIGRGAIAAAQSGVTNSVDAGAFVTGYPAIENRRWRKASVVFARLPELRKQLQALQQRLSAIEAAIGVKAGTSDDPAEDDPGAPL
jgi:UDP-3-O-[3-hydroxymyristoyl] glucosamine N-acyltransferase